MPPGSSLFDEVNEFAVSTPWLHSPMLGYAKLGILLFCVLLLVGWWVARGRDGRAMAALVLTPIGAVVALAVQQLVIQGVGEARPYTLKPDALILISQTTDPSFPSDHACAVGAVAAGLFFVDKRLGWVASVAAALMAFARVYVGAHWPLDVVVGLAWGAAATVALILIARDPVSRLVDRLSDSSLRPLVMASAGASTDR